MTSADATYIESCASSGTLRGPCLELGVGYEGENCRAIIGKAGLEYVATDIRAAPGVDLVIDFEAPEEQVVQCAGRTFGSVLCLNVIEHVFDPLRVLDNVWCLVKPGGSAIVLAPCVWALHDYPRDVYRFNPHFYEEFARRRGAILNRDLFHYVGYGSVDTYRNPDGSYRLPPPTSSGHFLWSRIVHRAFNTMGRAMVAPSTLAIAAVLEKPGP